MKIRSKMQLQEIISYAYGSNKTFVFRPSYDTSIPEDQRFFAATPSGEFKVMVSNPAVIAEYKLGAYYYFDFACCRCPGCAGGRIIQLQH
jgi:hypothetical protein